MLFEKKNIVKSIAIKCLKAYARLYPAAGCVENARQDITRQNQTTIDKTPFFCVEISLCVLLLSWDQQCNFPCFKY